MGRFHKGPARGDINYPHAAPRPDLRGDDSVSVSLRPAAVQPPFVTTGGRAHSGSHFSVRGSNIRILTLAVSPNNRTTYCERSLPRR